MTETGWRLVIHGGAGSMQPGRLDPAQERCARDGLGAALKAGAAVLATSGSADAAVMDGRTRAAGAVSGLRTTRAPISLARHLLERGPHLFLSGHGADDFAR